MPYATLSYPSPDSFTLRGVDSGGNLRHLLSQVMWAFCHCHSGQVVALTYFCLDPSFHLIPDSRVALWLFTLAQVLRSHFRCQTVKGVHVPGFFICQCRIQQVGRTWCDHILAGVQGSEEHFAPLQCRHTDAFQWEFLTVAVEASRATVALKVQGCSHPWNRI